MTTTASPTYSARVRVRGQMTIPQPVRDALEISQGDILNLTQIGDVILLTPRQLRTPTLAEQFTKMMEEEGVTLADLLAGLDEERKVSWHDRQTDDS